MPVHDKAGDDLGRIEAELAGWEQSDLAHFRARVPERKDPFLSQSGTTVAPLYTPLDRADGDYLNDLGMPGRFPFTRGPYPTMYRGRPWTMRQIAGFGTARETNGRFKYLIGQGQTGISCDFDMPTLMGYDSDNARSLGEVGREGVAIDTLADVEELFDGIDLARISVSMTINAPAWILLAMYLVAAEKRGIGWDRLSGTVQADILKEFIAQKEWIYPVRPSMRIMRDIITFSVAKLPHYNPINVSGYHIREAGATAAQEVAFTLANGIAYVEEIRGAGLDVDEFAPRLAFYFIAEADFFEEVAKFRAARRLWARIMRDRFGATRAESMRLRFHCQTAGSSLTAREPLNNIARTALQALSAVLGGAQSLHTNGMDEALAIPSEQAMKIALRTQQIILDETGAANTIDPLGGSYFVESLTDRVEHDAREIIERIERVGGAVVAVEENWTQRQLAESAFRYQQQRERGDRPVVGVTHYRDGTADQEPPFELQHVAANVEPRQKERLARVKAERDCTSVARCLVDVQDAARSGANIMEPTLAAVRAYASEGELVNALVEVFGRYRETPVF